MAVVAAVVHIHIAMDLRWAPVVKAVVQQGLAQTVAQHHRVQQTPAVVAVAVALRRNCLALMQRRTITPLTRPLRPLIKAGNSCPC